MISSNQKHRVLPVFAAFLVTSLQAVAQSPASKTTSWQDLGYNQLPEQFSTDLIPMFEGLNAARGTWSFEGEITGGDEAATLRGTLTIGGSPKRGMFPFWQMAWGWPADDPDHAVIFNVMAAPRKGGFDLMLIRMGPVKNPEAKPNGKSPMERTMFQGAWNLKDRKVVWTERNMSGRLPGKSVEADASHPKQTFEMVVAADGKIQINNYQHAPPGQITSGRAIDKTGVPPAEPVTLTGAHRFKTAAEVLDQRIKPWLPPEAKDITLLSERSGHYARYKVDEEHFTKFLDGLWEADQGKSAHQRDQMGGEGEIGTPDRIIKRLQIKENESPGEFIRYHSPSKPNAAMTTYYYNRETGIVYHDRGYW